MSCHFPKQSPTFCTCILEYDIKVYTDMKVCVLQAKPADGMGDDAGDTGGRL